ncbi:hypothetical protein NGRA_3123, partial [Nosema granulosis]
MIDTGANRTFISLQALPISLSQKFIHAKQKTASLADGHSSISILGTLELNIIVGDMTTSIETHVVKELCTDCILEMDFISKYKFVINATERTVSMCDRNKCITLEFDVKQERTRYPARTIRYTYIPPGRTVAIPVNLGISSAEVSFHPSYQLARRSPMILLNNMTIVDQQKSHIALYNPTSYPYALPKGIILGTTTVPTLSFNKCLSINRQLVDDNITKLIQHITDSTRVGKIKQILHYHERLFDTSKPAIVINVKPHEIKTLDHPPPSSRPYHSTPQKEEEMYNIVQGLLYHGLIRKSYS